jgi:hypothetical protein
MDKYKLCTRYKSKLDDWHALAPAAQADLARLLAAFPPNVRVVVTTRGAPGSAAAQRLRQALPGGLAVDVCGLGPGPAQRAFYLHMMRSPPPQPATP